MPDIQLPEGGFGASHPNLGDVGNLIFSALNFPGKVVRTVLGGGDEERFNQASRAAGSAFGQAAANPLVGAALRMASPLTAAPAAGVQVAQLLGQDPGEIGAGMGEMMGQAATDPLSYIGMGIPGGAARAAVPGSRIARILETADRYDKLPAVLFDKAVAGVQGAGTAVGTRLDTAAPTLAKVINPTKWIRPEIMEADKTVRPSNDLLDFLIATSKGSHYRNAARNAEGASESLIQQNYDINRGILDQRAIDRANSLASRAGRTATPDDILDSLTRPYNPSQYMQGKDVIGHYNQVYENAYKEAPNAAVRVAVLEVMRDVDIANKRVWDATYGTFNTTSRGTARTTTRTAARDQTNAMYKDAMDGIRVNMQAGEDVIQDMVRRFADVELTDVEEKSLTLLAHKTKSAMDAVRKTPTEGVFPASLTTGIPPGAKTPATVTVGGVSSTPIPKTRVGRSPLDSMGLRYYEMEERIAAQSQLMDALQAQVGAFLGPRAPDVEPARLASMIGQRRDEIGHVLQGEPGILALLPEGPQSQVMSDIWSQLIRGSQKGAATKNAMEEAFGRVYERLSGSAYTPLELGQQTPEKIFGHLNKSISDLAAAGHIPSPSAVNNQADFLKFIRAYGGNDEFRALSSKIKDFRGVDLLNTDPIAASYDRAIRMLGPSYGITEPETKAQKALSGLKTANQVVNSLYRDSALATLTYPLVNAMGALANHSLAGMMPFDAAGRVFKSMAKTAVNPTKTHYPESMDNLITLIGEHPYGAARGFSSDLASQTSQAVREMNQIGQSAWEQVLPGNFNMGPIKGNATTGAFGALAGSTGAQAGLPADATPEERNRAIMQGALIGATTLGVGFPTMSKYVKRLAMGVEDAIRGAEWEMAVRGTLVDNAERYQQIIRDALAAREPRTTTILPPGKPPQQYPVGRSGPSTVASDKLVAALEGQGWMASPERLNQMLTEAGVAESARSQAVTQWRQLNHEANVAGQKLAGQVQFDYEHLNNFEEFMRDFVPFSTYVMKANPFFARHLLEKPIIFATLARMQHDFDAAKREKGLTGRVSGATNFGIADAFWSQMLGYNVMAYYNPLKSLFPWSNTARASEPRPGENPYESLLRIADLYGIPQPGPIPAAIGRLAGIQGDAPAPNLIRSAAPVQGLTAAAGLNRGKGIDIGAGIQELERDIRTARGQDVAEPNVTAVMARLPEIYLATYGKPISEGGSEAFPFYQAIANQSGPLWDHAARQIARERGSRGVLGATFGPLAPQALVTGEEAQIRAERKLQQVLAPEYSSRIQQQASANPTRPAPTSEIETMREAALFFVNREFGLEQLPSKAQALLDSGTWQGLNQVRKDMAEIQREKHPLSNAYVATGGTEEAKLQALLALQSNMALGVPGGEVLQAVTEGRGNVPGTHLPKQGFGVPTVNPSQTVLKGVAERTQAGRQALTETHPILTEYHGWKLLHPDGTIDDFLRDRRKPK